MLDKIKLYAPVIRSALLLAEALAKHTETGVDDAAVAMLAGLFERVLGGEVTEMALVEEQAAILPILLGSPALLELARFLFSLFKKAR